VTVVALNSCFFALLVASSKASWLPLVALQTQLAQEASMAISCFFKLSGLLSNLFFAEIYFFEEVPLQIATKIVARDFFPEILTDTL